MKYLASIFFLLIVLNNVLGQLPAADPEILIGAEVKLKRKEGVDKIIGEDINGIYTLALYSGTITISNFDNQLKLSHKNSFDLKYNRQKVAFIGAFQFGGEILLFTSYRDSKLKTNYVFRQVLDKNLLTFSRPQVLIEKSYKDSKARKNTQYSITISQDSSFLLLVTKNELERSEVSQFSFKIYNSEMEQVWEGVKIENNADSYTEYNVKLSNDGELFVLNKIYDTSNKYKRDEINYSFLFEIYGVNHNIKPKEFIVDVGESHISDIGFKKLSNGNIYFVGLYSQNPHGQNGVFEISYDSNFNLISQNFKEFSIDFMVQHLSSKEKKKTIKKESKGKGIELEFFKIGAILENSDNTITLVAEQYQMFATSYSDRYGNVTYDNNYVYDNILVVKFGAKENIEWMELIPKSQRSTNDEGYYSGYSLMQLTNGNIVLLFNDDPKNSYYENSGKFYTWLPDKNNTDLILIEISEEGSLKRRVVYKSSDEDIISRLKISEVILLDQIILVGESRGVSKLVKLLFD